MSEIGLWGVADEGLALVPLLCPTAGMPANANKIADCNTMALDLILEVCIGQFTCMEFSIMA
jgi:hypothetical protein